MWIDDVKSLTKLDNYEEIKRAAENQLKWRDVAHVPSVYIADDDEWVLFICL